MNLNSVAAVAMSILVIAISTSCAPNPVDSGVTGTEATTAGTDVPGIRRARIDAWLAAYEAADAEAYRQWLLSHRTRAALEAAPMEMRLQMYADDAQRWGGLEIETLEWRDADTAVVRAAPANGGQDVRVIFRFDADEDDRIAAMSIGPWIDLPPSWSSLDEFAAALQQSSGIPALALGVLRRGVVVNEAVAGLRRIDRSERAGAEDTFHWGSLGKSVTGTMLAALVRDGVLDWGTTVGEVLGDLPMHDAYREATLWQAMSHQAGFPEYTNFTREMVDEILAKGGETWTEKRGHMVEQILREPPLGAPGTVGRYSNAGVTVAGYMAERLTGRSWRELVQQHVFDALQLHTAGFDWPAADGRSDQPYGHFGRSAAEYQLHEPQMMADLVAILDPAGNVRSSIGDMLRYGAAHLRAMRGDRTRAPLAGLHRVRAGAIPVNGEPYTFGWGHRCTGFPDDVRCHWHNGSGGSFYAELRVFPDHDLVLAFAGNAAEPTETVSGDVMRALFERYSR